MNQKRQEFWSEMVRDKRIYMCLNAAIRYYSEEKIKHWQKIAMKHIYGEKEVPNDICDW